MRKLFILLATVFTQAALAQTPVFKSIDINPGPDGSYAIPIIPIGANSMLLQAADNAYDYEPWTTDGTVAGTHIIKDIAPGTSGSINYSGFSATSFANSYLFIANDGIHGSEIWVTDGTNAGTQLLKDINPTNSTSIYSDFSAPLNGKLYFLATDYIHGITLWSTDGTTGGTQMVNSINPISFTNYGATLLVVNNKLFFNGNDGVHGNQLWVSDGTAQGTQMLTGLNTSGVSDVRYLTEYKGKVFFKAYTPNNGFEIWYTDGTVSGTNMLKDINPGGSGAEPGNMTVVNNLLFFLGDNGINGQELWVTDGTSTGTKMLKDISPGASNASISNMTAINNRLYFSALNPATGSEPWISDGTSTGTMQLKDVYPGTGSSIPQRFFAYKKHVYFIAQQTDNDFELWQTDGSNANTKMIVPPNATQTNPFQYSKTYPYNQNFILNPADSSIYFSAHYDSTGYELWIMTDSTNPTNSIADINNDINFTVYPNPCNGVFTLQLNKPGVKNSSIQVYDMMGREVYHSPVTELNTQVSLEVPPGIYLVKLKQGDIIKSQLMTTE